jgi:hypothetical protein
VPIGLSQGVNAMPVSKASAGEGACVVELNQDCRRRGAQFFCNLAALSGDLCMKSVKI